MIGVGNWVASSKAKNNVMDVMESGRLSYGPYCKEFEESIANMHSVDYGVLANSGTSALQVALQAMKELHGWADGDEVLVPAATFVATYNIVLHNKLTPILVDVDPHHYLFDIKQAEKYVRKSNRVRAIIPVHLFGQPADVRALAFNNKLRVLEDSCEAINLDMIALGDITCFSFYIAHLITTGVGGMAITDNPDYARLMRSIVNHGRDNIYISIDDGHDRLSEVLGKRFSFERIGHSFRITELEAAIGVAQLDELDNWAAIRRANALFLSSSILSWSPLGLFQIPLEKLDYQHSWMMYPLVCRSEDEKKSLTQYLEEHGIETRDALPLVTQPVYGLKNPQRDYPNAYRLATQGFYVGCHQYLKFKDMEYISDCIQGWYNAHC